MSGISGFGTELRMGRGNTTPGPETFDAIANVTNIAGPGFAVDTIDVTAHDSAGAFEEVIASIIRTGELSLDINYDPTEMSHSGDATPLVTEGLLAVLVAREARNFELEFPTTPAIVWSISGFVTGFEPGAPYDDKLSASVTIKLTGQPTLA